MGSDLVVGSAGDTVKSLLRYPVPSSSDVVRVLDVDPDSGTILSTKSNALR